MVQEGVDARLIGKGTKNSLKQLGQELSKYYDFLEIAEKQSQLGRGTLMANLTRIGSTGIGGTIGANIGGLPGAVAGGAVGLAGESLLRDPEVLKVLYQMGLLGKKVAPGAGRALTGTAKAVAPFAASVASKLFE